jgi:hypothetical protein
MTAHDLIASIFARVQASMPGDARMITTDQLVFLRDLIGRDEEGSATRKDGPNVEIWAPMGRWKYRIEERPGQRLHKLSRFGSLIPAASGMLF